MTSVAIIGGGLAGLAAADHLHREGLQVTVLEARAQIGGLIQSERIEGYLVEHGPNTLRSTSPLLEDLITTLGLEDDRVEAHPDARNRYIVRGGHLIPLPSSPPRLLSTQLLSFSAKLRLLREPFIRSRATAEDETVADFVRRRFGAEALAYAADPFVAGIFAGDPERLSISHAFPALLNLEQQYGSVLKGMVKQAKEAKMQRLSNRRPFSFKGGLHCLPDALAAPLGERICLGASVTAVRRRGPCWVLSYQHAGRTLHLSADVVLSTIPLHRLAAIDVDVDVDMGLFQKVWYPPVSVVALGFRREDLSHALDGFGFLVPSAETRYQILGTIFSSTLFPDRAPQGHVLLTSLVGGACNPELALAPPNERQEVVLSALTDLLGLRGHPTFVRHVVWEHAIPQYEVGYGAVRALLQTIEEQTPGFFMAGNYVRGIAVGETLASAIEAAQRIVSHDA